MGDGILFNRAGIEFPIPSIVSWATGTDSEILAMVEADRYGFINLRDYWSVGDTRTVNLSAMSATYVNEAHVAQSVELVLMDNVCTGFTWAEIPASGITVPRFIVGMKDCLKEAGYMNSTATNAGGWKDCARRSWCNDTFKKSFSSTISGIFKEFSWKQGVGGGATSGLNTTTDTFAMTPAKAIFGSTSYSFSEEAALYSNWLWYQTASNRIKKVNTASVDWWGCSPQSGAIPYFGLVYANGNATTYSANSGFSISPFSCI